MVGTQHPNLSRHPYSHMLQKVIGVDFNDLGTKSVLAAAAFYRVAYEFELAKGSCCGTPGKKNAFSEIKPAVSLDACSPLGNFCGHMSICRHFMELKKKADTPADLFARSDASSWIEYLYERLDVGSRCSAITKVDAGSTSDLAKAIRAIDAFLTSNTYLVGEALSVADFVCVVTIDHLVSIGKLDEAYLNGDLRSLARFIRTVKAQDDFVAYTKKLASLQSGDANVESSFSVDTWKKTYSNCKGDLEKEVMPWLWENVDAENWSFYFMTYNKLPDECTSEITTSNMLSGFLQRFEPDFRRISFGVINVMGTAGAFDIMGVWLIKGKELPMSVTEHPSFEFHTFQKLDITKASDKKLITNYFCAEDEIDGVTIADAKVWK
ncbi:Elongation factor 1 gamma, conserved domain- containing protein [Babesia divergens]|uniref:Elongation factor 1 gamma, conserved domain-containing protein n=1 Tax=Babesia divergens TaxID=32595 RepID=A0AAD9G918_BABDI|nr:Elongation factor 1 gamma, conserved domain- containing protein [Babesia divergens]